MPRLHKPRRKHKTAANHLLFSYVFGLADANQSVHSIGVAETNEGARNVATASKGFAADPAASATSTKKHDKARPRIIAEVACRLNATKVKLFARSWSGHAANIIRSTTHLNTNPMARGMKKHDHVQASTWAPDSNRCNSFSNSTLNVARLCIPLEKALR